MKRKFKAFTLSEMFVVLVIIAVISVIMISVLGSKTDRNKGLFKKAYSITEKTIVELVNDETYYPYNIEKFGFKEDTDVYILGAGYCTNSIPPAKNGKPCKTEPISKVLKLCNLFSNNLNITEDMSYIKDYCTFTTNDGIFWKINAVENPIEGFLITINVDGKGKGMDLPAKVGDITDSNLGPTTGRDKYFMYVRDDGKIQLPEKDKIAKQYLRSGNLNEEQTTKKKN